MCAHPYIQCQLIRPKIISVGYKIIVSLPHICLDKFYFTRITIYNLAKKKIIFGTECCLKIEMENKNSK